VKHPLPDTHPIGRRKVKLLTGLHPERRVPRV
jgi:hypothetical protein